VGAVEACRWRRRLPDARARGGGCNGGGHGGVWRCGRLQVMLMSPPTSFFFFDREVEEAAACFFFLSAIIADGPAGPNLHQRIRGVRLFATCLSVMTNRRYHKTSQ
jgi:hypothetical protein